MRSVPIVVQFILGSLLCFLCTAGAAESGRVRVPRADLRAGPAPDAFVVSTANEGEELNVLSPAANGWVKVEAPQSADLWIYSDLVREGVVIAPTVLVRAGPGIGYASVGQVLRGERLTVRGHQGEWLQIAPPPGCALYVGEAAVGGLRLAHPPAQGAMAVTERPIPSARVASPVPSPASDVSRPASVQPGRSVRVDPSPVRTAYTGSRDEPGRSTRFVLPPPQKQAGSISRSAATAAPVSRVEAPRRVAQPGETVVSGSIRPAGAKVWRQPSPYRIVADDYHGRPVTVCYLVGDEDAIERCMFAASLVQGRLIRVPGVRHPVLRATSIRPAARR